MTSPLVFTITEKDPTRRPRDCLKPMNRLQLYPSSFKKNRFVQFYQCTIDNSLCSFRQFEGKPSCEASYCKILVINNPIKHNRGVPSSEAARPRPGQPPPPRPAPVEATQSSLSFVVPVSCSRYLGDQPDPLCPTLLTGLRLLHNARNVLIMY